MVKTADFSNGFTKNLTYTDKHGYEFLENSNLYGGELILSNVGSIGKCFIVPELEYKMTLAPNAVMIRLTSNELRDFLYYFILSSYGQSELQSITTGVAMQKFNKTELDTVDKSVVLWYNEEKRTGVFLHGEQLSTARYVRCDVGNSQAVHNRKQGNVGRQRKRYPSISEWRVLDFENGSTMERPAAGIW